jgi:hypothetical protein
MKSQSTVGAGDSMVGAMTLRLAEDASLEDMVRFGVAAGSAATINRVPACARWKTRTKSTLICAVAMPPSSADAEGVAKSSSWSMLKIPWITTG